MKTIIFIILLLLPTILHAETTIPHEFAAGNIIKAEEINDNFTALCTHIDTLAGIKKCGNNIKTEITTRDNNNDGTIDSKIVVSSIYDIHGYRKSAITETDTNNDGIINKKSMIIFTIDENGNRVRTLKEYTENDGTLKFTNIQIYRNNGKILREENIEYTLGGSPRQEIVTKYTYDNIDNLLSKTNETFYQGEKTDVQIQTFTYDTTIIPCNSLLPRLMR